jgi:arginine-tRNA-protein transferase
MPARKFKSEPPILYGRYRPPTGEWVQLEGDPHADSLESAYAEGFLPFSGNPSDDRHLFYRARSLRVRLEAFAMDKKRRYGRRTWLGFGQQRQEMPKSIFLDRFGPGIADLAREWMESRFEEAYLDPDRLDYILGKSFLEKILTWTLREELIAFALIVPTSHAAHYWFVFYKNADPSSLPSGEGYLIDFLHWCGERGLSHAYLGTAYGNASRYKTRGLEGVEFWDGKKWNPDRMELRRLRGEDEARDPSGS